MTLEKRARNLVWYSGETVHQRQRVIGIQIRVEAGTYKEEYRVKESKAKNKMSVKMVGSLMQSIRDFLGYLEMFNNNA